MRLRRFARNDGQSLKIKGVRSISSLPERRVVTCFLEAEGEILLLRRSERVGSYQGMWAGVSGYVEQTADEQALIEIAEETSLSGEDLKLIKKGEPLAIEDAKLGVRWVVYPYLFRIKERSKVSIDWEHQETTWINPRDIGHYDTVPHLEETLARVYPS